jgi:hypothetical protein
MGSTKRMQVSWLDQVRSLIGWAFSAKTQAKIWGAVLIALAVAWSTYLFGPSPTTRVESTATILPSPSVSGEQVVIQDKIATSLATSRIRFPDWQQLIKTPADDATRRSLVENFRGETVTWEGYYDEFHEIDAVYGGSETNRFLLSMYDSEQSRTSTALGRAPALCGLPESAREQVADLKPGQRVIIKGPLAAPETLHGTLIGTRLYNCEILVR